MTCQLHSQLWTYAALQEDLLEMHHQSFQAQAMKQISRVPGVWVLLNQSQWGFAIVRVAALAMGHPVLALYGV